MNTILSPPKTVIQKLGATPKTKPLPQAASYRPGQALCLACSPRRGGNSDYAASRLCAHFTRALGVSEDEGQPLSMELLHLRDYPVAPCRSCGICERPGSELSSGVEYAPCSLDKTNPLEHGPAEHASADYGPALFERLFEAPQLLICSPIYFYHLPTLFKALIDRSQYWWMRKLQGHPRFAELRPKRPAHVVLLSGRPKGDKLFEGSLVTLKYFLNTFGFELREPLVFRGLDAPVDLAANPEMLRELDAWADVAFKDF